MRIYEGNPAWMPIPGISCLLPSRNNVNGVGTTSSASLHVRLTCLFCFNHSYMRFLTGLTAFDSSFIASRGHQELDVLGHCYSDDKDQAASTGDQNGCRGSRFIAVPRNCLLIHFRSIRPEVAIRQLTSHYAHIPGVASTLTRPVFIFKVHRAPYTL